MAGLITEIVQRVASRLLLSHRFLRLLLKRVVVGAILLLLRLQLLLLLPLVVAAVAAVVGLSLLVPAVTRRLSKDLL